jgi:hypothetical protein
MYVKCKSRDRESDVFTALVFAIRKSRFTAELEYDKKYGIKLYNIRLKRAKPYCGQHPGPCVALFPRPHRNHRYLEGLDWVGWNQMLNDVLDKMEVEADAFSFNRESLTPRYFIRRGRLRRLKYPYEYRGNFAHWTQGSIEEDFVDCNGKEPPAIPWYVVDAGTPGYPCYTVEDETRLIAEEAELPA